MGLKISWYQNDFNYTKNGIKLCINFPKAISFREVELRLIPIASFYRDKCIKEQNSKVQK